MSPLLLHPLLPFLVAAVLVRILPRTAGHAVMVIAPLVALAQVWRLELGTSVTLDYLDWELEILRVDGLSTPFGVVFALAALISGIYGISTQLGPERSAALVYAGAAFGVVFAGDLLTFFVFWETKAIASTLLILARRTHRANRAGMRYLFVHILGGKLLLGGIILHVWQTDSLAFTAFEPGVAAFLILTACLLSAAAPPLHAWLSDAYPEATIAGTVFLSAFTTKSAVYALARGFAGFEVLIYLGVVMALYGVLYAMLENDIRRLLSYHIVSQVGFMVAGVGIGTELAINGATAHAFAHILYKGLLLMGVGSVLYATGRSKASELGGIANRMRLTMTLYLVGAVSIASFPLFSGFTSKELIIAAASSEELAWLVLLLKIASVGTFLSTGLKLPYATWVGSQGAGPRTNDQAPFHVARVPVTMLTAMGVAAGLNLLLGVAPQLLYDLLPYPVTYDVYSFGKVVEKLQILAFTGLGFWLMIGRLKPKASVNVDTDWVYRKLPLILQHAWERRHVPHAAPAAAARGVAPDGVAPDGAAPDGAAPDGVRFAGSRTDRLMRLVATTSGPPPLVATWLLGASVMAAAVVLLFVSLT